jgi:hypothetical protein
VWKPGMRRLRREVVDGGPDSMSEESFGMSKEEGDVEGGVEGGVGSSVRGFVG